MLDLSPETEALVRAKAAITGKTPDEIVREALAPIGNSPPGRRPAEMTTKEGSFRRLDVLAARSIARERQPLNLAEVDAIVERSVRRPVLDARTPDEIIGYDEFGIPK